MTEREITRGLVFICFATGVAVYLLFLSAALTMVASLIRKAVARGIARFLQRRRDGASGYW